MGHSFSMLSLAQISGKNMPVIHPTSEPDCCLLTNRFKATKVRLRNGNVMVEQELLVVVP